MLLALLAMAVPASAEIVFLSSGRTLSVKSHRVDGDQIVLTLRSGGEVTCDKDLVEKIEPDEVPYIDPDAAGQGRRAAKSLPVQQDSSLPDGTPYGEIIASMSEAHGVNPLLVRALIEVESSYRPTARSRKGAMGLMQLMPSTAREYKVRNPFEPKANIEAGIKHLKTLIDRFGRPSSSRWPPTTPGRARSRSSTAFRRTARPATTSAASWRWPASSNAGPYAGSDPSTGV